MSAILTACTVVSVERLSPSFTRVTLTSPELADFGVDGQPLYDQRIKLIFPGPAGLPSLDADSWWTELAALPADQRAPVRTYTVREHAGTTLVVDFVIHPGAHGPGSDWAAGCSAGDRILVVGPRRGTPLGGIEFVPGDATRLLLAGDETAVPAMAAILSQLPADAVGAAFLEVPVVADVQTLVAPAGMTVTWLPRDGAPLGKLLHEEVLAHVGAAPVVVEVADLEVDPDLWETPTYSSSGEEVTEPTSHADRYVWIAGESKVVTGLRRALVNEVGLDRGQVAFMGYWREGVAMRG
ncbi:siderophore-interacting protein [Nocardioides sp.]|uniref:siderophore-interacting protein n=1 Tax=Nocardioides sp. TaxID=35761 RepID=UPI0039E71DDC